MKHCCLQITKRVEYTCAQHSDRFDCPDCIVEFNPKFREYGIIVHDGGMSVILIKFCPWCGEKLPSSLRDRWFAELKESGHSPFTPPDIYQSDAWYRDCDL